MIISLPLPKNGVCLLKAGKKITFGEPFFQIYQTEEMIVPVAKKLNINPSQIFKYLKKFVGEKIEKNEILAEKKDLFSEKRIRCDKEGVIKQINHHDGTISICIKTDKKDTLTAFFSGEIFQIKEEVFEIKVKKGKVYPVKESNADFGGEVGYLLDDKSFFTLSSYDVTNKFILVEQIDAIFQAKNEALGAGGFISLNKLPEKTDLYFAQIKNIDDFKNICYLKYPYCLNVKEKGIIYFYE
jgi:hypothetical protein